MVRMHAQVSSSTGARHVQLARLLRYLIFGTVAVSNTCCLHTFFKREAAASRYNGLVVGTPLLSNWTVNVGLSNGGSISPEAERLLTDAAAPILQTTQASSSWKAGRSSVFARFVPPLIRGSFRDGGAQACLPLWHVHEACVDLYAAGCSSECRHGEGKNNGVEVGACRGVVRKNGKMKGNLLGGEEGLRSRQKKGGGVGGSAAVF